MRDPIPSLAPADSIFGPKLLGPHFGPTFEAWETVIKAAFALPIIDEKQIEFFNKVSGRKIPSRRCRELFIIAGRRSGKTAAASGIVVWFAVCHDFRPYLRPGERAVVMCLAVDREQAKIILSYIRAYFTTHPALKRLVIRETQEGLELTTGAEIVVATNSFRSLRGRTNICTILDECAFYRSDLSANPDTELYAALQPCHATLPGSMIIGISSPYRRAGLLYDMWSKHWGQNDSDTLVIRGASTDFNPTLDPAVIARALEADPAAASAEWLAEWRSDIEGFIDLAIVQAAVVRGRIELPPTGDR